MVSPSASERTLSKDELHFQGLGKGYIRWVILALLADKPLSGYELKMAIATALEGWRPSPGTLYPILHKLRQKGLIKGSPDEKEGRKRIVYYIQPEGIQSLEVAATQHVMFVAALHKLLGKHGPLHPVRLPAIDIDHVLPRVQKRTKVFLDEIHLLPKGVESHEAITLFQNRLDSLKKQNRWLQAAIARVQSQIRKHERLLATQKPARKGA